MCFPKQAAILFCFLFNWLLIILHGALYYIKTISEQINDKRNFLICFHFIANATVVFMSPRFLSENEHTFLFLQQFYCLTNYYVLRSRQIILNGRFGLISKLPFEQYLKL